MDSSPSKFNVLDLCARKFYGVEVEKWKLPDSPSKDFGTDVHALVAAWLTAPGAMPDVDSDIDWQQDDKQRAVNVALSLLPLVPAMGSLTKDNVERWSEYPLNGSVHRGRVDFFHWDTERWAVINDIKTLSDLRYVRTAQELESDWQAVSYALWAMGYLAAEDVTVKFLYVRTRPPHYTRVVEVQWSRKDRDNLYKLVVAEKAKMDAVVANYGSFAEVPPTETACGAYGGCPFRMQCAVLGVNSAPPLTAPRAAPHTTPPPGGEEKRTMKFTPKSKPQDTTLAAKADPGAINPPEGQAQAAPPTPPTTPASAVRQPRQTRRGPEAGVKEALGDQLEALSPGCFQAKPLAKWRVDELKEAIERMEKIVKAQGGIAGPAVPAAQPAPPVDRAAPPVDRAAPPAEAPDPPPRKAATKRNENGERKVGGYTLYINCAPSATAYRTIEEICEPLMAKLTELRPQIDPNDKAPECLKHHPFTMDYKKGERALSALLVSVRRDLEGAIVLADGSEVFKAAYTALVSQAKDVVRGF